MGANRLQHAISLHQSGRLEEAIGVYHEYLKQNPGSADGHHNLAAALKALGRWDEAMQSGATAIRLNPSRPESHYNLGNLHQAKGDLIAAEGAYREALLLRPRYAEAANNLALVLAEQGRLDESIAYSTSAIGFNPDLPDAYINLLYCRYHHPESTARFLLEETRQWAARQQRGLEPIGGSDRIDRLENRRKRIGYLSPFFGDCADAHFIYPLLAHHDRERFDVRCFSLTGGEDGVTRLMRGKADEWVDLRGRTAASAAEVVRSHHLDVLVVMSRPADACQAIAGFSPAAIAVNWLTFASATSGQAAIGYRISDPALDAGGQHEADYSERTVYLPATAWCYEPLSAAPGRQARSESGGGVTFGSLNRISKINGQVIRAWADILARIPDSRLRLLAAREMRDRLAGEFEQSGIERGRIEFLDRAERNKYLNYYVGIDIVLDTFPFNGHTTTMDALWMGAPVVTLAGATCVGRVGASALENLGLAELIARSPVQYVEIACGLAADAGRRRELRERIAERMPRSALMDHARFARDFEAVLTGLMTG